MRMLVNVIIKNFKRMIESKSSIGLIFFGPFIILLMVAGAYSETGGLNIDIGMVGLEQGGQGEDFARDLQSRLNRQQFTVIEFDEVDVCLTRLKRGNLDICVEVLGTDRPKVIFHVDYSKLNLINKMTSLLSKDIEAQSGQLQMLMVTEMGERIGVFSDVIKEKRALYANVLQELSSPSNEIAGLQRDLQAADAPITNARGSMENIRASSAQVFQQNKDALDDLTRRVVDIRSKARSQRQTINELRTYNQQCDEKYLEDVSSIDPAIGEAELRSRLEQYGRCKCVEFYSPNLESLERDIESVEGYATDTQVEIDRTKQRNQEFYNTIITNIDLQQGNINQLETQKNDASRKITSLNAGLLQRVQGFGGLLDEAESLTQDLSSAITVTSEFLEAPIEVRVNPVSRKRELIVYMFPIVYFFILLFVAILFSSTFTYSEKNSMAAHRNVLSPLNSLVHVLGAYISLIILIILQSVFILVLGNWFFKLNMHVVMINRIVVVTAIVVSVFILLGILIGKLVKSQLIVILLSIGVTITMFLYSSIIRPEETMPAFARFLISINPFIIGTDLANKMILFDLRLGTLFGDLIVVVVELILVTVAVAFVYATKKED